MPSLLRTLALLVVLLPLGAAQQANGYRALQLERGEWIFEQRCIACHEQQGRGLIGPNLTDWSFLNGPTRGDLKRVIGEGVPERGMPAWGEVLDRGEIHALLVYVWSLRGRELPGKEPQGAAVPPTHR